VSVNIFVPRGYPPPRFRAFLPIHSNFEDAGFSNNVRIVIADAKIIHEFLLVLRSLRSVAQAQLSAWIYEHPNFRAY
jgi:hypothetical protein